MKFSVQTDSFRKGLQPAINIATKDIDKDFDYGGRISLDVQKDKIIATAHGGGAQVTSEISNDTFPDLDYKCTAEGSVTLDTDNFVESLNSFRESDCLSIDDSKGFSFRTSREVTTAKGKKSTKEGQVVPVQTEEDKVTLAKSPDKFDIEIKVNREVFIKGMGKTRFAVGFEDSRPDFNSQVLLASKSKLRFVAGTGARFAVMDFKGTGLLNILQAEKSSTIFFPKHNVSNLLFLLGQSDVEMITIKQSSNKANIPDQIAVEFGGVKFVFLKVNTSIKYPVVDKVLNNEYHYKVSTNISEWCFGVMGVSATNTLFYQQESPRHNAEVKANFEDGWFNLDSKTNVESDRCVVFSKIISQNGVAIEESSSKDIGFVCNSRYLNELYKNGENNNSDITISFENQFLSEDGKSLPILVNYPKIENEMLNTEETFSLFFAPAKLK